MTRPDRATVLRLLATDGQAVTVRTPELIEDADGIPAGVEITETTATLHVSVEALGWTYEELGIDPEVDQ